MLILGRRPHQTIEIRVPPGSSGELILVTVLDVGSRTRTVRLGIEADRSVEVLRGELTWKSRPPSIAPQEAAGGP